MDRGAWWAADSGVTKSQTQLSTDSTSELMTRIFSCFSPSHSELCWALLEAFALNDTFWYQCKHQRCFTLHLLFFPCQCGKREHNLAPFARSSQLYGGSDLHSKGGHRDLERERDEKMKAVSMVCLFRILSEGNAELAVVVGWNLKMAEQGEQGCGLATVAHVMNQLVKTRRQPLTALLHECLFSRLFNLAHSHHTQSAGKVLVVLLTGQAELGFGQHVQLSVCGRLLVTSPVLTSQPLRRYVFP